MIFEKIKYLASTYKNSSLNGKLPKRTIYEGVYFIFKVHKIILKYGRAVKGDFGSVFCKSA